MTQPSRPEPRILAEGSRSLSKRRRLQMVAVSLAGLAAYATAGNEIAKTSYLHDSVASTAPQTANALIVAKVYQPGGQRLEGGLNQSENVWQPANDAVNSVYNLVLSMPGELQTVTVAVSPEVYAKHCQAPKFFPEAFDKTSVQAHFAPCGVVKGSHREITAYERLDTTDEIPVTFTRSKLSGKLQITGLGDYEKRNESLLGLLGMRREMKVFYNNEGPTVEPKAPKATM